MRWPDGFMWGSGASSTQTEAAVRLGQTGAPVASIFGLSDVRDWPGTEVAIGANSPRISAGASTG